MKAIYKNIALAALALSAVACTQDEDFAPSYLNDPDAVRITAQVASGNVTGGFTRNNPLGTTEDEQAKFNSGDKIAVTAGTQTAVTYTFNGTDIWTPEAGKYLKWEEDEMNFTAWYPVGKNNASATTFNVPTGYTEESPIAAADYMVYTGTQNKTNGNGVTLPMERKMARIVITPILNDEFPETNYSITDIKVHANTSGYASGTVQAGNIEVTALEQGDAYYALLAPTTAADATFLTVTVTKTDDSTSQELTVEGIPNTTAGQSYEYTLTVGKAEATIGNVKVNPWTDETAIPGGEAVINYVWTSGIEASASVEGNGTEESPYLIHSANDLQWMIEQVNNDENSTPQIPYYRLTHDLEIDSEEGATWTPIGTADDPFEGYFDGGGYTIRGKMHTTTDLVGFFGCNAGTISNLKNEAEVKDCRILMPASIEYSAIGSIAGSSTGKIIHCENSGDVTAANIFTTTYTGGICGYQYRDNDETIALITECKNSGDVTGVDDDDDDDDDDYATGGIVGRSDGYIFNALIMACENAGSVTCGGNIGGICGLAKGPTAIVACLNTGNAGVGGIFGGDEYYDLNGCCTTKGYIVSKEVDSESFYACYTFDVDYVDENEYVDYNDRERVEEIVGPWNDEDHRNMGMTEMNYAIVQMNFWSLGEYPCNWHWEVGENNIPKLVEDAPLGRPGG